MLLADTPTTEIDDVDATNLIRLLCASAKKAIGEKIVPATDNRNPHYTKAQKVSDCTCSHCFMNIFLSVSML